MAITSLNNREYLRRSQRNGYWGRDYISKLPDELLCKILSSLTTKNSVSTSGLSRKWRNLWSYVPALDLETSKFKHDDDFWDFFYGFLESNKDLVLTRFKLVSSIEVYENDNFVSTIDDVVKRRVCHLTILNMVDLDIDVEDEFVSMPLSLYSCTTLVNLELYGVFLETPGSALVSLPCVKTMTLKGVMFHGDQVLTTLISSCSVLEELVIVTHIRDKLVVIRVSSQSLKNFELKSTRGELCDPAEHPGDPELVIYAPRLEYMSVCNYHTDNIIIRKIGAFTKMNLDLVFDDLSEKTMISNFLTSLSVVGEMIISARSLKMIDDYHDEEERLPEFSNLSRLHVFPVDSSWVKLQIFLGYCPNLHSLDLDFECFPEPEEIDFSYVPECFISSLEYVKLRTLAKASDKKLAMYFLRNCVVLKKMVLSESFENIMKEVRRIRKKSGKCKIIMANAD